MQGLYASVRSGRRVEMCRPLNNPQPLIEFPYGGRDRDGSGTDPRGVEPP
jgi:hypothetical protein